MRVRYATEGLSCCGPGFELNLNNHASCVQQQTQQGLIGVVLQQAWHLKVTVCLFSELVIHSNTTVNLNHKQHAKTHRQRSTECSSSSSKYTFNMDSNLAPTPPNPPS
jgi:hypothetical protein